jgi:ABC-type enterochelin transport system ATPase subunit
VKEQEQVKSQIQSKPLIPALFGSFSYKQGQQGKSSIYRSSGRLSRKALSSIVEEANNNLGGGSRQRLNHRKTKRNTAQKQRSRRTRKRTTL